MRRSRTQSLLIRCQRPRPRRLPPNLIDLSNKPRTEVMVVLLVQQRAGKLCLSQIALESLGQIGQFGVGVIMTDRFSDRLPDMLLGVQLWTSHREPDDL